MRVLLGGGGGWVERFGPKCNIGDKMDKIVSNLRPTRELNLTRLCGSSLPEMVCLNSRGYGR